MKSTLLASLIVLSGATIAAQDAPLAQWGNILYGNTNVAQADGVAVNKDGSVLWLNNVGTNKTNPDVMLNDEVLFTGELSESGNSSSGNLTLINTDRDGRPNWIIYSTSGDYASNQCALATDSEGNVVFTAKVRHGGSLDTPINIIDAEGTKTEVGGATEQRNYALLIAKATPAGKLLWHKYITLSTVPGPNATKDFIADAVKSTALAVDDQNNIYVGGNFCADMTVDENVTLTPNNVADWSGDAQTDAGSYFIIKFNGDGEYTASATGNSGLSQSQALNLTWSDDALYLYANATGENGYLSVGGKKVAVGKFQTPVLAKLNADLTAEWARSFFAADVAGACVMQNSGISVIGDNLWFCGMFNGAFADAEGSDKAIKSNGKTPREGALIRLDSNTGEWLAATTSRAGNFVPTATANNGLQGYFSVLQNPEKPGKCYVYGYVMNKAVGIFLREYDAETLVPNLDNAWNIATEGGVPSATGIAYDKTNNTAFITGRGNKAFSLLANPAIETFAPASWSVLMAKYDMPADLKQDTSALTDIQAADKDTAPVYYDLMGIRINGNMAPGIYIKAQGDTTEKIIIR